MGHEDKDARGSLNRHRTRIYRMNVDDIISSKVFNIISSKRDVWCAEVEAESVLQVFAKIDIFFASNCYNLQLITIQQLSIKDFN